jgi:hypothetical protein
MVLLTPATVTLADTDSSLAALAGTVDTSMPADSGAGATGTEATGTEAGGDAQPSGQQAGGGLINTAYKSSCDGCIDSVILEPRGGTNQSANALNVTLPEGPNGAMITVTNLDQSWYLPGQLTAPATVQLTIQVNGPGGGSVGGSETINQVLPSGSSYSQSLPGPFVGPGTINLQAVNQSTLVLAVTLVVIPIPTQWPR